MKQEIEMKDLEQFRNKYKENNNNSKIEQSIKNIGLRKTCLNKDLASKYQYDFNIEIPKVKIYDQKKSYQCNIYAFLRVIKSIMQKENPTLEIDTLDLSANYLDFYDKLEKVNSCYNDLMSQDTITLEDINNKVNRYVGIYGTFHYCRELVKKYGLVPTSAMQEASVKYDAFEILELLKAKIKADATLLIDRKEKTLEELKSYLMKEAYIFLSKTMGNPPLYFKWDNKEMTPLEFKNQYLKSDLEDYVTVISYDKETFYNSYAYIPNVYLKDTEEIKTLSMEQIKNAVVRQLKDGIGVWFSSEESTTLDYDLNLLDDNIYKYKELLNIKEISKEDKLTLDLINYDHAMCIIGAKVENGKVLQFKVDNSFDEHGKYKGHLIMTNSFFENDIITIVVNKKYLD